MTAAAILSRFDRTRFVAAADWLAAGVAVSLPWSTSATSILVVLWLLAVLPTIEIPALRRVLATAAGWLPVLLWLLAAVGMLWADVTWHERFGGLGSFHRFLVIPLLLMHVQRTGRGLWLVYGFFAGTVALLVVSYALAFIPGLPWRGREFGVPTKDYIFQSTDFLICAFGLFGYAADLGRARRWRMASGCVALALAFLANIFFVVTSRTGLLVVPVLLILLGWREWRWKGVAAAIVVGAVAAAAVWSASPYLRDRLTTSITEFDAYRTADQANSTGLHLEFMRKGLSFVETAPIAGHGTGSIPEQFRNAVAGRDGAAGTLAENPHNQILAVAIQLGVIGAAVLVAMWLAHLLLFMRAGDGLIAWFGVIVVVQNIVSSAFNSHLFDFTSGWLYVFGVGALGGMVLRARASA